MDLFFSFGLDYNGAAAELRAEGPSVLAACSAGAGGRTRGALRRGPVQPGACARLNGKVTRVARRSPTSGAPPGSVSVISSVLPQALSFCTEVYPVSS
jgi:hypothetical protein